MLRATRAAPHCVGRERPDGVQYLGHTPTALRRLLAPRSS